jgi:hypothetical protein
MENMDRPNGNTQIVDPLRELEIAELMKDGFFYTEALDLATLSRKIPKDAPPLAAFELYRQELIDFRASLIAPRQSMISRIAEFEEANQDFLEQRLADPDESGRIDFGARDWECQDLQKARHLSSRLYHFACRTMPVLVLRIHRLADRFR